MKVTFVNYYYDKDIPIENYLDKYPAVYDWCKALSDLGIQVKVFHRFDKNYFFKEDQVEYFLINDDLRHDLKWYQTPFAFHKKVTVDKHDILHVNSFIYAYQASFIKNRCSQAKIVISITLKIKKSIDGCLQNICIFNGWLFFFKRFIRIGLVKNNSDWKVFRNYGRFIKFYL
jgi:hypothetical protein